MGFKLVVTDDNGNTEEVLNVNVQPSGSLVPTPVIDTPDPSNDRHSFSPRFSTTPRGSIELRVELLHHGLPQLLR